MKTEVLTDNEMIAEFMGVVTDYTNSYPDGGSVRVVWYTDKRLTIDQLEYPTSWDWLIPVVEKIHSLDLPNVEINIERFHTAFITKGATIFYFYNLQCGGKIGATYKAVVEFIKWYNQQKQ